MIVHTNTNPDLLYVSDLIENLNEANTAAYDLAKASGNDTAFFFIQDQEGRGVQKVEVREDMLSDGSKAYTVILTFDY